LNSVKNEEDYEIVNEVYARLVQRYGRDLLVLAMLIPTPIPHHHPVGDVCEFINLF
jgi:hypothetical protein